MVFPTYVTHTIVIDGFVSRFEESIKFSGPRERIRANSKSLFDNEIISTIQSQNFFEF